jgi:uncharacterized repeat protein (TIGR03803 family)
MNPRAILRHSDFARLTAVFTIFVGLFAPARATQPVTVLHSFSNSDGNEPTYLLLAPDETLYGVTFVGGGDGAGSGVLYKIDAQNNFSILHVFQDWPVGDGSLPNRLLLAPDKSIYGLTASGGPKADGTVYRVDAAGKYAVLHSFDEFKDGGGPNFLILAKDGNFYGTASTGGVPQKSCQNHEAHGTFFRMTPAGKVTRLHTFCQEIDGAIPNSVTEGADGFLYGTCKEDGPNGQSLGAGTFWRASYSGKVKRLHVFGPKTLNGDEPTEPNGVLQAPDGFFYGTANSGGLEDEGAIFRANASGKIKVLHSFDAYGRTGNDPETNFFLAENGFFYGTTAQGGLPIDDPEREGTVYRVDVKGHVELLHTFSVQDGATPVAPPVRDPVSGTIYATAIRGGDSFDGTVVRFKEKLPSR